MPVSAIQELLGGAYVAQGKSTKNIHLHLRLVYLHWAVAPLLAPTNDSDQRKQVTQQRWHCTGRGGAGKIAVCIYHNLPQFFSDASIQNFHFSPEESSFPTFAVTRHTVRVCVLICRACHLCGRTLSVFVFPKCHPLLGTVIPAMVKRQWNVAKDRARYATQISRLHGVGTGSVERFFSFGRYTDTGQRYSMSNNAHHVAFMAHMMVARKDGWISCLC